MNTLRLSLVLVVLGVSVVLTLWVLGWLGASEVVDSTARTVALVAIGGAASSAVFALLSGRRPSADREAPDRGSSDRGPSDRGSWGPPANGPQF